MQLSWKECRFIFLVTFSLLSSSSLLKVPIVDSTTSPNRKNCTRHFQAQLLDRSVAKVRAVTKI